MGINKIILFIFLLAISIGCSSRRSIFYRINKKIFQRETYTDLKQVKGSEKRKIEKAIQLVNLNLKGYENKIFRQRVFEEADCGNFFYAVKFTKNHYERIVFPILNIEENYFANCDSLKKKPLVSKLENCYSGGQIDTIWTSLSKGFKSYERRKIIHWK